MFLAIINDTYAEVKSNIATQKSEFEIGDYFKKVREPERDPHRNSPNNNSTFSNKWVMRIKRHINWRILSFANFQHYC